MRRCGRRGAGRSSRRRAARTAAACCGRNFRRPWTCDGRLLPGLQWLNLPARPVGFCCGAGRNSGIFDARNPARRGAQAQHRGKEGLMLYDDRRAIAGKMSQASLDAFGIDETGAIRLRAAVHDLSPSPLIFDPRRVSDYGRQHEIPESAMDLFRRTREIRLSDWEEEAIRVSLNSRNGTLRRLLDTK